MNKDILLCNRNFGCRIKEYISNGFRMLSLENSVLKVVIILDKGADIYEFVYKPLDIDFMFHYPMKSQKNITPSVFGSSGNFLDYYEGGWQELFPNIGSPCKVRSAEYGMHGEVALLPWDLKIICDEVNKISVELSVSTIRTPYKLVKTLTILEDSPILFMDEEVINEGNQNMEFQWGHHPALGGNFLDDTCEIMIKGNPKITGIDVDLGDVSLIGPAEEGVWPNILSKDGTYINLSQVKEMDSKTYMEFSITDLEDASYIVKNNKLNLGFGMEWDKNIFPNIWVWQMFGGGMDYPFYGRAYTLALEPWSSLPGNLEKCIENGTTLKIRAGESKKVSMKAFVQTF